MLLQSWGNKINIFPAVPAVWKDAVFHDLSAEGAFLVSASRKDGKTGWIRIKSLAGEPCRVQTGFTAVPRLQINGKAADLKPAVNDVYELPLIKGDEALLYIGELTEPVVTPVPMTKEESNQWGGRNR
jgi:hypothetical protein